MAPRTARSTTRKPARTKSVRGSSVRSRIVVSTDRRKAKKKSAKTRKAEPKLTRVRKSGKDHGALPSWIELESKRNTRVAGKNSSALEDVSTARLALAILCAVVVFTAYIGHVQATVDTLAQVQQLERDNSSLRLRYNRVKGDFDRLTGPVVIYARARELGLIEGTTDVPRRVIVRE